MAGFNRDCEVDEQDQGEHPQQMPESKQSSAKVTFGDDIRDVIDQRIQRTDPDFQTREAGG